MKKRSMVKVILATVLLCATGIIAAESEVIKGNKESKIYHKPSCCHYAAKGCTETFKTEDEAVKAGYKSCKVCGKAEAKKADSSDNKSKSSAKAADDTKK